MAKLAEGSLNLGIFLSLFRRQKTENSYRASAKYVMIDGLVDFYTVLNVVQQQ
jgi:hypothetical protein